MEFQDNVYLCIKSQLRESAGWYAVLTSCSEPMFWPFSWNCTPTTPTSSTAVATRFTVPVRVVSPTIPGENSDTIGGAMTCCVKGCDAVQGGTATLKKANRT